MEFSRETLSPLAGALATISLGLPSASTVKATDDWTTAVTVSFGSPDSFRADAYPHNRVCNANSRDDDLETVHAVCNCM